MSNDEHFVSTCEIADFIREEYVWDAPDPLEEAVRDVLDKLALRFGISLEKNAS